MPKAAAGLTARKVETIKTAGLFADGGGLYLQVTATGAKTWIFRYSLNGRRRDMGLGSLTDVGLAEAREKRRVARDTVKAGRDPIDQRKAEEAADAVERAKAMTFRACAEAFIAAHRPGWRNDKHSAQWSATLQAYAYPVFGDLPVAAIDTGLVLRVLEPIWSTKSETASRLRGRIESVLDWARVRGYREGENPARWRGHLDHLLPAKTKVRRVEHHAALPYAEMPAFFATLAGQSGMAALALRFAILTAARTGEVLGARWDEVDLEAGVWTIPATRMKAGREHRVPLAGAALDVLRGLAEARAGDVVFFGQKAGQPLSNMSMLMLLRRMGRADITTHGFRSAFKDWASEQTDFPSEVSEMALAHVVGDKVEAAYRRGDLFEKRRALAEAWAKFCCSGPRASSAATDEEGE